MSDLALATCQHLPIKNHSVDMIFTDPPYRGEYLECYQWLATESYRVLKYGGFVFAMCGGFSLNKIYRMFDDAGLKYFWTYQIEMPGKQTGAVWHYGWDDTRRPITVHQKSIIAYSLDVGGPRTATTDVFVCNGREKLYHHWGQDVASARYFIDCFTWPDEVVIDPFIGGGTTAVACNLIGRKFFGFDTDPVALNTTASRMAGAGIPTQIGMMELT